MRRRACNTSIANDNKNVAEQITTVAIDASSTGQETISEPESEPKQEIIKLRRQLEEKDKQIATLQASQNVQDIPQLDDKMGPIKVQNLFRISEDDRRACQALARRWEEKIRRRMTEVGHASIKFYVTDRTTGIEYLVPVAFTVDMRDRTIKMELDESRL